MPPRRTARRHLQHGSEELVLRSTHLAAVREAFRAGEDTGRIDGVAEERTRTMEVISAAEPLNLIPLAMTLLASPLSAERIIQCLHASPPATRQS